MARDPETTRTGPESNGGPGPRVRAEFGQRLRAAREGTGIGLRELARRIGVSASLVSQIETGKVHPSVDTLFAIVTELRVSMDDVVFGPEGSGEGGERSGRSTVAEGLLVQRADDRDVATFGSGVRWERLTPTAVPGTEFLYVVYEPGAESSAAGTFQRHDGREWSIILRGTLHVSVAFDEFELGPGDSITYDSTVPHRLVNRGDETVHALWFQIGDLPSGGHAER